jgi:hypothetical protein
VRLLVSRESGAESTKRDSRAEKAIKGSKDDKKEVTVVVSIELIHWVIVVVHC